MTIEMTDQKATEETLLLIKDTDGIKKITDALPTGTNTIGAIKSIIDPLPAGTNAIGKLAANSGVDIGDVTVDNGVGAGAVNIQDGGNSITVDGSVTVSGSVTVQEPLSVDDNGASLTVDAVDLDVRNLTATDVVTVTGGAGQTADVKVTLDGETVGISSFPDNEPFNLNQLAGTALAVPFDVDSGAGTQNVVGVSMRKAASGGSVEYGTSTDPIRIDPVGATTQPVSDAGGALTVDAVNLDIRDLTSVSDSVAAAQSGTWNVTNISGTISLPTGAATETTLSSILTELGQKTEPANTQIVGDAGAIINLDASGDVQADILSGPTGASALQSQGAGAVGVAVVGNPVMVGGTDGTNTQRIKTDTAGELQIDVLTLPATPAGTNEIGKVKAHGDTAHDAVDAGDPVKVGGKAASVAPAVVASGDRVNAWLDLMGRLVVQVGTPEYAEYRNEFTANQTNLEIIVAPGAGKSIIIYDIILSTGTAGTVLFRHDTSPTSDLQDWIGKMTFAASSGIVVSSVRGLKPPTNRRIMLTTTTGAGPLAVYVNYAVVNV